MVGHVAELIHLPLANETFVDSGLTACEEVFLSRLLVVLLQILALQIADCFSNCLWFRLIKRECCNRRHGYVSNVWDWLSKCLLLLIDFLLASYDAIRHG